MSVEIGVLDRWASSYTQGSDEHCMNYNETKLFPFKLFDQLLKQCQYVNTMNQNYPNIISRLQTL